MCVCVYLGRAKNKERGRHVLREVDRRKWKFRGKKTGEGQRRDAATLNNLSILLSPPPPSSREIVRVFCRPVLTLGKLLILPETGRCRVPPALINNSIGVGRDGRPSLTVAGRLNGIREEKLGESVICARTNLSEILRSLDKFLSLIKSRA